MDSSAARIILLLTFLLFSFMLLLRLTWTLTATASCFLLLHNHLLSAGHLVAGTCEIITLNQDNSQPRTTIAHQTVRCACMKGQIAGTTRTKPACVEVQIVRSEQWCEMIPCLDDEGCNILIKKSGWTCTQKGGRIKTTTVEKIPIILVP
ncbi:chemokine-like protein TAFA-5 [Poeciliopsis prolifica]|uniref:chemokine-like protein TAFA-5 n=1 Tax=Poeciliopsis prolifica TaxID=188132 RepID=UPI00072D7583|nr:chemokine-like protein TAFA-5 [Poeciliopsis prolifica]